MALASEGGIKMSGMIGMASGDQLRHSQFVTGLMGLEKPAGTVFMQAYGFSVATNWNMIAKQFLEHPDKLEWLLLIEDDHILPQEALVKLLSHNVDIVSALYVQRQIPFTPVIFDKIDETGKVFCHPLKKDEQGLIEVAACGGGCLLIRRNVLETLKPPYWYYGDSDYVDATNHDINFSKKARKAGFKLYCDLDLPIIHLASIPVVPYRDANGKWCTRLTHGINKTIEVGAAE